MPAIVKYKNEFPSLTKPVESSASVAASGLVTGNIVFIIPPVTLFSPNVFSINQPISQLLFSSLEGVNLQGLFVESRALEKRNGINYLRLGVVGAINPPVPETRKDVSPRSISKTETFLLGSQQVTETFSFDYHGESYSVTSVFAQGKVAPIAVPTPTFLGIWNRRGKGTIRFFQEIGQFDSRPVDARGRIVVTTRILTTETEERRAGIVVVSKTSQFVFE